MNWKICLASIAAATLMACGSKTDSGGTGGGSLVLTATPSTGVIANGTNAVLIHVDGSKQVGNLVTAWNPSTRACTGCHGADTW